MPPDMKSVPLRAQELPAWTGYGADLVELLRCGVKVFRLQLWAEARHGPAGTDPNGRGVVDPQARQRRPE